MVDLVYKYQLGRNDSIYENTMAPKYDCLAIAGAGTKGGGEAAALAGLKKALPDFVENLEYLVGSSAGACIAAQLAAGATPEKIIQRVKATKFNEFKDIGPKDGSKFAKVIHGIGNIFSRSHGLYNGAKILADMRAFLQEDIKENLLKQFNLIRCPAKVDIILKRLKKIGLIRKKHTVDKHGNVTDITLHDKITFKHLNELAIYFPKVFKKLRITGTNVKKNRLEMFCANKKYKNVEIAQAVKASMSIPWVFKMEVINGELIMDGGCLNNFAMNEFDKAKYIKHPEHIGQQGQNLAAMGIRMISDQEMKEAGQKPKKKSNLQKIGTWIGNAIVNKVVGVAYKEACEGMRADLREKYNHRVLAVPDMGVGLAEFNLSEAKQKQLDESGDKASATFAEIHTNEVMKVRKFKNVESFAAEHPERLKDLQTQLKKGTHKEILGVTTCPVKDDKKVEKNLRKVNVEILHRNCHSIFHRRMKKVMPQLKAKLMDDKHEQKCQKDIHIVMNLHTRKRR